MSGLIRRQVRCDTIQVKPRLGSKAVLLKGTLQLKRFQRAIFATEVFWQEFGLTSKFDINLRISACHDKHAGREWV